MPPEAAAQLRRVFPRLAVLHLDDRQMMPVLQALQQGGPTSAARSPPRWHKLVGRPAGSGLGELQVQVRNSRGKLVGILGWFAVHSCKANAFAWLEA